MYLLKVIIEQNYFQYNNQFFQLDKVSAMGSPISVTLAEIYLQLIEETFIKQLTDSREIIYYKRYVNDILILFDRNKTNDTTITNVMNRFNEHLCFKASEEINNSINYLDLTIHRNINKMELRMYRKPTSADVTIQYTSNQPQHINP